MLITCEAVLGKIEASLSCHLHNFLYINMVFSRLLVLVVFWDFLAGCLWIIDCGLIQSTI